MLALILQYILNCRKLGHPRISYIFILFYFINFTFMCNPLGYDRPFCLDAQSKEWLEEIPQRRHFHYADRETNLKFW